MRFKVFISLVLTLLMTAILSSLTFTSALAQAVHGYAMHGNPKYAAGFTHFDYVNPNAPKGGVIKQASLEKFDSFNPYIQKGIPAEGSKLLYDTLTVPAYDEPFSMYGLVAESLEIPEDRGWVRFKLNPKATFHDGHPIEAEDVVFSFNTLITKGAPLYQFYYADVSNVVAEDKHTVKFEFKSNENKELALIIGQVPVLPKHFWEGKDFAKSGLDIPMGSGPYKIKSFEAGKRVVYERDENYWAKDHPTRKGRFNFEELIFDIYLESAIALEAFKSGDLNFRDEKTAKSWATQYIGPKFESGELVKLEIPHSESTGMQGFAFNIRKEVFQDPILRQAMAYAFDFEWSNKNLFYGQYKRTNSYFENTELGATGLPSEAELAVLNPFKKDLPPEVFTQAYQAPVTDGGGKARKNLRAAKKMLQKAGYTIKDNQLISPTTGKAVAFEMLLYQASLERIVLPFKKNLKALGIEMSVRKVDVTQYISRMRSADFDMLIKTFPQSNSPGNEQREFWSSASADKADSRNIIGIKSKAIDGLIEEVITANSREDLVVKTRALDRALLWGHYVIPNWHLAYHRIGHSKDLQYPDKFPEYHLDWLTWWSK